MALREAEGERVREEGADVRAWRGERIVARREERRVRELCVQGGEEGENVRSAQR